MVALIYSTVLIKFSVLWMISSTILVYCFEGCPFLICRISVRLPDGFGIMYIPYLWSSLASYKLARCLYSILKKSLERIFSFFLRAKAISAWRVSAAVISWHVYRFVVAACRLISCRLKIEEVCTVDSMANLVLWSNLSRRLINRWDRAQTLRI